MNSIHKVKNHVDLANLVYSCIDLSERDEGETLLTVILSETGGKSLTVGTVENWLRGLPSVCSIPYWNDEIRLLLDASGNNHWSVDDYWRWSASRVLAFAKYPKAYE